MHDALAGSAYEQRRETRFRRKSGTIVWAYITTTLVRGVLEALHAFTGPAEPHDDVTLLAASLTIG